MTLEEFRRLADTWGGDIERWPHSCRNEAKQCAATEEGGGKINWYFANTKSAACPRGFGQEETIKAIWMEDKR